MATADTVDEVKRLTGEVRRLNHIIGILKYRIQFAAHDLESIDLDVRIRDGVLEVCSFGEWVDVEKASAEAEPEEP